jgi:hypothetical protein
MIPSGVRWHEEGELAATLRPRRGHALAFVFASAWNFGLSIGLELFATKKPGHLFLTAGLVGGTLFLALAVRALVMTTQITFDPRQLVIRTRLAPWATFTAPLVELASFAVVPQSDSSFRVAAITPSGASRLLPLDVEALPVALKITGSNKRIGAAPEAYSTFLASRLHTMLEAARRSGRDTYRS